LRALDGHRGLPYLGRVRLMPTGPAPICDGASACSASWRAPPARCRISSAFPRTAWWSWERASSS